MVSRRRLLSYFPSKQIFKLNLDSACVKHFIVELHLETIDATKHYPLNQFATFVRDSQDAFGKVSKWPLRLREP